MSMPDWRARLDARDVAIRRFCVNSYSDLAPRHWAARLAADLGRAATLRAPSGNPKRLALANILALNNGATLSRSALSYVLVGNRTPGLKFTEAPATVEAVEPIREREGHAVTSREETVRRRRQAAGR